MAVGEKRTVTAQRDTTVRRKGWRQEAIPRLLENTLEVGERPEELIVYAGSARAARDWDSWSRHGIARAHRGPRRARLGQLR